MNRELPKTYDPKQVEGQIYDMWLENDCFRAEPDPDKKPYSIVMPPPNVTGQLHMGHALDATLQDILTRYKRMQGYSTLWLPGTDHAGIATQIKVEEDLRVNEGKTRYDLGREKFLERVWAWKEKYGGRIVEQQRKLGVSCDWSRERFLDEAYPTSVSTFCVRDAQGREYRALLKTKHFLNALYMRLLTGGNPDGQCDYLQHFHDQWYNHTPQGVREEYRRKHYHYRRFSSRLLEWYFCCKEAVPHRIPRFKPLPDDTAFLLMWADFGGALFWNDDHECCGASDHVWVGEEEINLSDIPELATWEYDFDALGTSVLHAREDERQFPYGAIAEEERAAWHVRGLRLAHQLRPRLPLHYVLLYEQSWDLAYGTPYFANDSGRIIFDERFIEKEEA